MEVAKLYVSLILEGDDYTRGLDRAASQGESWAKSTGDRISSSLKTAMLVGVAGISVAVGAAFAQSANAAIEFESAFAGVVKTVGDATDSVGNLTEWGEGFRDVLRGMAKEIPVTVEELARIAELGGQLGVAGKDLEAFTDTIAKVAVTTNLTAESAATSFAQLGNVMGSSQEDLTRLASSVVALGNNMATTEADIVNFASRISGAAAIAGLTEADIVGIGAAFSSVGVQAEAGGTAVQKVLLGMNTAVTTGGDDLAKFAEVAGLSAAEFATAWDTDAAGAFTLFVEGLGTAGDDAILLLQDLGLQDQRLIRSFLSLAGAGDLLRRSIELSSNAFKENTALQAEAEQRFKTTESQIQLFKNTIHDLFITVGNLLLPIIGQLLVSAQEFVNGLIQIGVHVTDFVNGINAGSPPLMALAALLRDIGIPPENIAKIMGFVQGLQEFAKTATAVGQNIVEFIGRFIELKDVIIASIAAVAGFLLPAFASFLAPVILFGAIVAGLTLVFAAVRTAWEADFAGIRTAIGTVLPMIESIGSYFLAIVEDGAPLNAFLGKLPEGLQGIIKPLGEALARFIEIKDAVVEFYDRFQERAAMFGGPAEYIKTVAGDIWTAVEWIFTGKGADIDWWGDITGEIISLLTGTANEAGGAADKAAQKMAAFGEKASIAIDSIKSFFLPTIERIKEAFAGLADGMEPVNGALDRAKEAFLQLWEALQPVLAVLAIAIATTAKLLGEVLGEALQRLPQLLEAFLSVATGVFNTLQSIVTGVVGTIVALVNGDWAGAWEAMKTGVLGALAGIGEVLTGLASVVDAQIGIIWDAIRNVANDLLGTTIPTWNEFKAQVIASVTSMATQLAATWEGIKTTVTTKFAEIGAAVTGAWDAVKNAWETLQATVATAATSITTFVENLKNTFINAWASLTGGWDTLKTAVATAVTAVLGSLQLLVDKIAAFDIGAAVAGWIDTIKNGLTDRATELVGAGEAIVESIKQGLATFGEKVFDTVSGFGRLMIEIWNETDWYELGASAVNAIFDGLEIFTQDIPNQLAEWGTAFIEWGSGIATDLFDTGKEIVASIIEGLDTFTSEAPAVMGGWWDSLKSEVSNGAAQIYESGKEIVASIIEGLKTFASEAPAVMGGWWDALKSEVSNGAAQIYESGKEIVASIIEGLKTFTSEAPAAIREWWGAITDQVSGAASTLYAAGKEIVTNVIEGLKSFASEAPAAIREWAGTVMTEINKQTTALVAGGKAIATSIVEGLRDFVKQIGAEITAWVNQIGLAIAQKAGEIKALGGNIIAGIKEGITSGAKALYDAVSQVAQGAIDTFRDRLGINSPAKAFIPSGQAIPEGIAAGIFDKAGVVKEAVFDLAEDVKVSGVDAFSSAIRNVVGAITPALRALSALSSTEVDMGVLQKFQQLRTIAREMVDSFAVTAYLLLEGSGGQVFKLAEQITEAFSKTLDVLTQGMEALAKLATFEVPTGLGPKMQSLSTQIAQLAIYMGEAATNVGKDLLHWAGYFSEGASAVAALVTPAVDALDKLKGFEPITTLRPVMENFMKNMRTLVEFFAIGAYTFADGGPAAAAELSEAATTVAELVGPGIEALTALAEFEIIRGLAPVMENFMKNMRTLVEFFATGASTFAEGGVAAAQQLMGAATAVAALVGPGIEALTALAEFEIIRGLAPVMENFMKNIRTLVEFFVIGANTFKEEGLEAAKTFADTAKSILDLVEPGIEAIVLLSVYVSADIKAGAAAFGENLITLVVVIARALLQSARVLGEEALPAAGELGGAAGDILGLVGPGIEAISALTDAILGNSIKEKADQFATLLIEILTAIVGGLTESALWANEAIEGAADLSKNLKTILGLVKPAADAITEIHAFVSAANLTEKALEFVADLLEVTTAIGIGLADSALIGNEAIAAGGELSTILKKIVDVIKKGMEALKELAGFGGFENIEATTRLFITTLLTAVLVVLDGLQAAEIIVTRTVENAAALAKVLKDIIKVIKPGVDALKALAKYSGEENVTEAARAFTGHLIEAATVLIEGLNAAYADMTGVLAKSAEIAETLSKLFSVVKPGVDALGALATYVSSTGLAAKAAAFIADLKTVSLLLAAGLSEIANKAVDALEYSVIVADHLKKIFAVVKPGAEALKELSEFTVAANLAQKTTLFINALGTAAEILVAGLAEAAQRIGIDAVESAIVFAKGIASVATSVRDGVSIMDEISKFSKVNIQPMLDNLLDNVKAINETLTQSQSELGAPVTKASDLFRVELAKIVENLQAGIDIMASLTGKGGDLQAILDEMVKRLAATVMPAQMQGIAIGNALKDTIKQAMSEVAGIIGTAALQILVIWRNWGAQMVEITRSAMAGVISAVREGMASVSGQVSTGIAGALNSALTGAMNAAGRFEGVGNNITSSMARGITNGTSSVAQAVERAAKAAVSAANATLEIASPSRVFKRIGEYAMAGLALAFADTRGVVNAVNQAMGVMANTAGPQFAASSSGVGRMSAVGEGGAIGSTYNYNINSPVPITSEGDVVQNVRILRWRDA